METTLSMRRGRRRRTGWFRAARAAAPSVAPSTRTRLWAAAWSFSSSSDESSLMSSDGASARALMSVARGGGGSAGQKCCLRLDAACVARVAAVWAHQAARASTARCCLCGAPRA
eukprot:1511457-Prymnesium_polylepis.1